MPAPDPGMPWSDSHGRDTESCLVWVCRPFAKSSATIRRLRVSIASSALFLFAAISFAQVDRSGLTGTVTDASDRRSARVRITPAGKRSLERIRTLKNAFLTRRLAELDPATGDVAYINAGHNVPILRRKSGLVERLQAGGIPIGIFAESPYQVGTTRLESKDWLVIFTDGIVEAMNAKDEEYGESELIRLIDRESGSAPAELLGSLLAELDRFVGNTPQHDDMTCLLLKRS